MKFMNENFNGFSMPRVEKYLSEEAIVEITASAN